MIDIARKIKMIEAAERRHHIIMPVGGRSSLLQCFTEEEIDGERQVWFWYNSLSHSTHIIAEKL